MEKPLTSSNTAAGRSTFRERLFATWWTWPLPLIMAVLLAAEIHMGYPGVRAWLPYVILLPVAIAVPLWLGRTGIFVRDGELHVDDAHLPLQFVEDAEVVTPAEKRSSLGPDLDPAAFVVHRPWIRTMVRVWLNDPADPTPYWMISTRRPQQLVAALGMTEQTSAPADELPDGADTTGSTQQSHALPADDPAEAAPERPRGAE